MLEQVALSSFSGFTRVATTLMARGRARRVAKEDCTNNTGQLPSPIENRRLCRKAKWWEAGSQPLKLHTSLANVSTSCLKFNIKFHYLPLPLLTQFSHGDNNLGNIETNARCNAGYCASTYLILCLLAQKLRRAGELWLQKCLNTANGQRTHHDQFLSRFEGPL